MTSPQGRRSLKYVVGRVFHQPDPPVAQGNSSRSVAAPWRMEFWAVLPFFDVFSVPLPPNPQDAQAKKSSKVVRFMGFASFSLGSACVKPIIISYPCDSFVPSHWSIQ